MYRLKEPDVLNPLTLKIAKQYKWHKEEYIRIAKEFTLKYATRQAMSRNKSKIIRFPLTIKKKHTHKTSIDANTDKDYSYSESRDPYFDNLHQKPIAYSRIEENKPENYLNKQKDELLRQKERATKLAKEINYLENLLNAKRVEFKNTQSLIKQLEIDQQDGS